MEEINKKNRNRHEETIITLVKQKDTSLAELRKKTSRQAVLYHIPKLCTENLFRVYVKGSGVKDEEIFYTFVNNYKYPQDVLKLINEMCNYNTAQASQAFNDFVKLCIGKGAQEEEALRIAHALMANFMIGLKEQLAFYLTINEKINFRIKNITYDETEEYLSKFFKFSGRPGKKKETEQNQKDNIL